MAVRRVFLLVTAVALPVQRHQLRRSGKLLPVTEGDQPSGACTPERSPEHVGP